MSAIFDYSSGEGVADAEAENPFTPETQGRVGPPFASKFRNPQQAVLHARESQPFHLRDSGEGRSPGRGTSIFVAVSQGDRGVL